jgi:hypothetical protein
MGSALRKMFGNQMVVFRFAFNQGSFQAMEMPFPSKTGLRTFNLDPAPEGSLDAMLASAGLQIAAIDLRALPKKGEVADWFSEPRATRSIGAGYGEQFAANFLAKQVSPKIYDALLFVEKTTAARPLEKAPVRAFSRKFMGLEFIRNELSPVNRTVRHQLGNEDTTRYPNKLDTLCVEVLCFECRRNKRPGCCRPYRFHPLPSMLN